MNGVDYLVKRLNELGSVDLLHKERGILACRYACPPPTRRGGTTLIRILGCFSQVCAHVCPE